MKNHAKLDISHDEVEEPPGLILSLQTAPLSSSPVTAFPSRLPHAESHRFYQHLCPPFPHEPTRDRFALIRTDAVGEGLISLVDIEPGEIVFTFAGTVLPTQTLFTLQKAPGVYVEDPLVMGKVLHSCDPNMICSMEHQTFWAIKPIRANDYLFMDYESTEDQLFREFQCCCGAPNCRGEIRGRALLDPQQRHHALTFADFSFAKDTDVPTT